MCAQLTSHLGCYPQPWWGIPTLRGGVCQG
jgi:hypothetical protein